MAHRIVVRLCLLICTALGTIDRLDGQCFYDPTLQLLAPDALPEDYTGISVALAGNLALVGSNRNDQGGPAGYDFGCVYVYEFDLSGPIPTWLQRQQIWAPDGDMAAWFGHSIAVENDVLVIGAPYDDVASVNTGSTYIFRRIGIQYVFEQQLVAGDAQADDKFGASVAISEGRIVVGAPASDLPGFDVAGAAYVFDFDGASWVQSTKLSPTENTCCGDGFGYALGLMGDTLLVGQPGASPGIVHVFARNGSDWVPTQELSFEPGIIQYFGASISLSSNYALVGAPYSNVAGGGSGAAYLFQDNGTEWALEQVVLASDTNEEDQFGASVKLTNSTAAIGAPHALYANAAVYAYTFDIASGSLNNEKKLLTPVMSSIGTSLDCVGSVLLTGSPVYPQFGSGTTGAAYLYDLDVEPAGCEPMVRFRRGDDNNDGNVNVADVIFNLSFQLLGGAPLCLSASDTNDDGQVNIADPIFNLSFQFVGGPAPFAPFVDCGFDPTSDDLACEEFTVCP